MNSITERYNMLVQRYLTIGVKSSDNGVHEKRMILRDVLPMLAIYKFSKSDVINGEKTFKLFRQLRDVQVQILKIDNVYQSPQMLQYLGFLKETEKQLQLEVFKFSKEKEIVFPALKKKSKVDSSKIIAKAEKKISKLVKLTQQHALPELKAIEKIRKQFKKFRYLVEILYILDALESEKLDQLKKYQDILGDIHDYELVITNFSKFCAKNQLETDTLIEELETQQNLLISSFELEIDVFVAVCKSIISKPYVNEFVLEGNEELFEGVKLDIKDIDAMMEQLQTNETNTKNELATNQAVQVAQQLEMDKEVAILLTENSDTNVSEELEIPKPIKKARVKKKDLCVTTCLDDDACLSGDCQKSARKKAAKKQ